MLLGATKNNLALFEWIDGNLVRDGYVPDIQLSAPKEKLTLNTWAFIKIFHLQIWRLGGQQTKWWWWLHGVFQKAQFHVGRFYLRKFYRFKFICGIPVRRTITRWIIFFLSFFFVFCVWQFSFITFEKSYLGTKTLLHLIYLSIYRF